MLINGNYTTSISAFDRGLHYGDGLFETIAVTAGKPCLWRRHMQRLAGDCECLGIPFPGADVLRQEALAEIGDRPRGVLKIILTRGEGGRGYQPPSNPVTSRLLCCTPWPELPGAASSEGVVVRICSTRLDRNTALAGIKHLNRLPQVLARGEWDDPGVAEGLMLDNHEHLIEGTKSNLFLVKHGRLRTPQLRDCGVAGVLRGLVMDIAAERGIPVEVTDLGLTDLWDAEALFLTNSLIGIWPVREVSGQRFPIDRINKELLETVNRQAFTPE